MRGTANMNRFPPICFIAVLYCALTATDVLSQTEEADWGGLYGGGNVGESWASIHYGDTPEFFSFGGTIATVPGFTESNGNLVGGGQLGYAHQIRWLVLGIEGNLDLVSHQVNKTQQFSVFASHGLPPASEQLTTRHTVETNRVAGFDARVGYAWDRLLLYGTAGGAFTDVKANANDLVMQPGCCGEIGRAQVSKTAAGWTAGAGVEWLITDLFSVAASYRHLEFGDEDYNLMDKSGFRGPTHISSSADEVSIRINLHFNGLFNRSASARNRESRSETE